MFYATKATVDLAAIRANLAQVRRLVHGRAVMQTVKADAYGHGALKVAQMIQSSRSADWLAVATVQEGIDLRAAGITMPILKLSGAFLEELPEAINNSIVLSLGDEHSLRQANAVAAGQSRIAKIHLVVDTGMGRIGCRPEEALALAHLVDQLPWLKLDGIFTHPPVADRADGRDYTQREIDLFLDVVADIVANRGAIPWIHLANSGAILSHDLKGTNLVRSGIMGYGYYPDATTERTAPLTPALSLTSRVSFVKQVDAGTSIGYGRTWVAPDATWIATIPIGYADGFSRMNSNRGSVLIKGRRYPIVGRVCMDQIMVDLGDNTDHITMGDDVTLLGVDGDERITADDLAEISQTISYEVLSLITARVERRYIDYGVA